VCGAIDVQETMTMGDEENGDDIGYGGWVDEVCMEQTNDDIRAEGMYVCGVCLWTTMLGKG
jgi:hypothetical protein